jgi:hypothetical protein
MTQKIIVGIFLYFAGVCVLYSQTGDTDVYGSYQLNGVLTGLSSPGRYAAVPHNFVLNQGLQGTVEAWVYLTAYNENNTCIYQKGSSFMFGISDAVLMHRPILQINGVTFLPFSAEPFPLNRWVHFAASWRQTGSTTFATFFIDGTSIATQFNTVNVINNTDSVTIGGSRLQPNSFVNGYLDEVRYWNRERTGVEIARNRFCGIGDGLVANQNSALVSAEDYSGLVSSWTFNEEGASLIQDYISLRHGFTRGGAVKNLSNIPGQPIPYNLAAYFPGGANDYIRVPDNNIFDRTISGTIDGWVYVNSAGNHTIISKGATPATVTFAVSIDASNRLSMKIGNLTITGPILQIPNIWNHFAVTWSFNAGICTIRFYINGKPTGPAANPMTMPVNADPVLIGNYQPVNSPFNGYIDELRFWARDLTPDEIKAYMFASPKSGGQFFLNNLLASWSFEGNLNNLMPVSETNGTFNIGSLNRCRFSGYTNESTAGAISNSFYAHTTAINRLEGDPFSGGYSIRASYKDLLFNTDIYDTISIPSNIPLTNIELFLSVWQPEVNKLTVTLKAPNGVERTVLTGSGGQGGSVLTFFKDGSPSVLSFNNPWSHIAAPNQAFGTFGNANTGGNWVLKLNNTSGAFTGTIRGWGLRINNSMTGTQTVSNNIPSEFKLYQNYPNPFNPVTNIKFDIPKDTDVKIAVYDMLGREVQVIADEFKEVGSYEVSFDASALSSGTYFYKINAGMFTNIKKMVVLK